MTKKIEKMSEIEFTKNAIVKLRKVPYKGIHSVFSGYNEAFRKYFGSDPIEAVNQMVADGQIETRYVKKGAQLYLRGEKPEGVSHRAEKTIEKIIG